MSNKYDAPAEVLGKLNSRSVCWLLAVVMGVKPATTTLSVDKEDWTEFLRALHELDLCWSYKGVSGTVLSCPESEAQRLSSHLHTDSHSGRVCLVLDDENRPKLLNGNKPSLQILSPSSAKLTPIVHQNLAVGDVLVSRNIESLLMFARFDQRQERPASFSNHIERGRALGYPDCCVDAYEKGGKVGLVARHNFFKELIDLGLDEKMPVEFWAIAHVPCSARCEESIELGKRYLEAVRSYSAPLYDSVLEKLRASYLAYSVGERFLSFKEIHQKEYPPELQKEYGSVLDQAQKLLSEDAELTLGKVQRPLVYRDWEDYPVRCRLIPELMGLKWIAYSPGEGMLVRDTGTNEVYLYGMLKWMLPREYKELMDTVCRVYRCA